SEGTIKIRPVAIAGLEQLLIVLTNIVVNLTLIRPHSLRPSLAREVNIMRFLQREVRTYLFSDRCLTKEERSEMRLCESRSNGAIMRRSVLLIFSVALFSANCKSQNHSIVDGHFDTLDVYTSALYAIVQHHDSASESRLKRYS